MTVELTHTDTPGRHRPSGRVWTVQLRQDTVPVANGLGHATACDLANQIADLLNTPPT